METVKINEQFYFKGRYWVITKIVWRAKGTGQPIEKHEVLKPALDWCEITVNPVK